MITLEVHLPTQRLLVIDEDKIIRDYPVSTAKNGAGEQAGSRQTPQGLHIIRAKIGANCPVNTVFVKRRPTGEFYTPELRAACPDRDWILTRILWLSGVEKNQNRLGDVDTFQRYIYIHGTNDEENIGTPRSHGCIRMRNQDIIALFDCTKVGDCVYIQEDNA